MVSILDDVKLKLILIGILLGAGLKMNFLHQIAKSSNKPPLGLSKAASKHDVEALAEFYFWAGTKTKKGLIGCGNSWQHPIRTLFAGPF